MPLTPSVGGWFGTGVFVAVGTGVLVGVGVKVGVGVLVGTAVFVAVFVGVDVDVGVFVGVDVGVRVGVFVGVGVRVGVDVFVGVAVGVTPEWITTVEVDESPIESVTVSVAVLSPVVVYGCDGFGAVECGDVSPKSHSYVSVAVCPGSGSLDPALEKFTVSGGIPDCGIVADVTATGGWSSITNRMWRSCPALIAR
jgi:hypothetical protein